MSGGNRPNEGTKVLSIVVPLHNEQSTIKLFYETVQTVLSKLDVTVYFYFIDDGSGDQTLSILKELSRHNQQIRYISFSRHFGKEAGIYAGLQHAIGDYVAIMDVDLQDPPELLPDMLVGVQSGQFDAVAARRINRRGENKIRSWFSRRFYQWMNCISQTEFVDGVRDYRVMTRQMVDAILSLPENQRFSKGIFTWVGFRTKYIPFENKPRIAGKSSWSFWSLVKYAIEATVAFSTVPLTIVTMLGLLSSGLAVLSMLFIIIRALVSNSSVAGWPSMVTIILFIGGIQLLSLGIIGRYVAADYLEAKRRPVYVVKEQNKNIG
ncbi:glycosyltransferase family 2 protein [Convivina intestini]|uniref:glycosyltransferase family 2 protein n=1 Tax=Convivina intestini TaxID=1505726 RepID=UPI00200DCCC7|nr:glycosyltransferase family 2 protein [Convivina intestini]CAH1850270.1 Putative glycosyltransferase CsbB [Convivina intestini]